MKQTKILEVEEIENRGVWLDAVGLHPKYNLYSSWSWSEYKEKKGWRVRYFLFKRNAADEPLCFCVVQSKRIALTEVHVVQGGPVLCQEDENTAELLIRSLIDHLAMKWWDVLVVSPMSSSNESLVRAMLSSGFRPHLRESMFSFNLSLEKESADSMKGRLSGNWRHNLKRAEKNEELSVRELTAPEERKKSCATLHKVYKELRSRKGFSAAVDVEKATSAIVSDQRFIMLEVLHNDVVVATRIGFLGNEELIDFLAASSDGAQKNYANYLALWSLIMVGLNKGVKNFECGGIDPANNPGVYNFKRGLGGELSMLGPRWVYARSAVLKNLLSFILD